MILQINTITDPVPSDLPIWLITLGIEAMILGVVIYEAKQRGVYSQYAHRERLVGVFGLGIGYFFLTLSLISRNLDIWNLLVPTVSDS
jgi:hypothetical protein